MRTAIFTAAFVALAACGSVPPAVAANEGASGTMLVANKRANSLSRVDLASGKETNQVASCANPHELAVSPDRAYVALACYSGQELEIYRARDLTRIKTIDLGEGARPHGVVWHDNGTIYSTAQGRESMFVIREPLSASPEVQEIGGGGGSDGPHLLAVNRNGTVAWGTIVRSGTVVRYDITAGREASRKVLGGETEGIALAADEGALWVGSTDGAKVYRLDPKTLQVTAEVPTGARPMRVAASPAGRWVVTDKVAEVDLESGKVLRRLPAGDGGDGLAVF